MKIREAGQEAGRASGSFVASRRSLILKPQILFELSNICQDKEEPHPFVRGAVFGLKALNRRNWRVDNVHTLGIGPGRMSAGSGRIPHVSAGAQYLQG
ncbi:hypothetical protein FCN77_10010 [Arthrobacter sp. 24S4-2]|uniref:hypothetical protein n=1 Tax=Arthrobacter sp. 24S4-2 TaxID=2575374 RepID=UPI0010C776C2|nr:hypothetical protein [Arthrobacter sp. 24S4-2]QCO97987.1 hypothetical protein FCN77_10010 [Arthrobacter sp. 24S4-2]